MGEKKRELVFMGQSWWFVVRGVVRRESAVFSLHTRFTALLLSIIIALMNIFRWRLPVTCFWDNSKFGEEDTLAICSATDLYTVIIGDTYANITLLPRIRSMQDIGGRMEDPSYPDPGMSPAYLKYYPHVIILQQIQLLAVLAPLFLWHCVEDGYMNMICRKFLNFSNGNEEKTQKHRKEAAEFLVSHLGHHSFYAWTYAFCELLNLFMVILQAWAMTWVAGGPAFRDVGWAAVSYYWNLSDEGLGEVANPVLRRFPTLAKCEFNKYGPAGSVVPHEGVCSLPLNYVIRIYFLVFWFYLILLGVISVLNVAWRVQLMGSARLRRRSLLDLSLIPGERFLALEKVWSYGDWFVFHMVAKNLKGAMFDELMEQVLVRLSEEKGLV